MKSETPYRAHQVRLSSPCQFSHQRSPSAPLTYSQMVSIWIMVRVWRTFLARSTTSSRTSSAWNTPWAHKTTLPGRVKISSSAIQNFPMVSLRSARVQYNFFFLKLQEFFVHSKNTSVPAERRRPTQRLSSCFHYLLLVQTHIILTNWLKIEKVTLAFLLKTVIDRSAQKEMNSSVNFNVRYFCASLF